MYQAHYCAWHTVQCGCGQIRLLNKCTSKAPVPTRYGLLVYQCNGIMENQYGVMPTLVQQCNNTLGIN